MSIENMPGEGQHRPAARTGLTEWLLEPHRSVEGIANRRQARLTALLSMIVTTALLFGLVASVIAGLSGMAVIVFGSMLPILAIGYLMTRTRLYRISAWLIVLPLVFSAFAFILLRPDLQPSDLSATILTTLPITLIIASALLNVRTMSALVVLSTATIFLIPFYRSTISFDQSLQYGGAILAAGLILVAVVAYRNSTEQQRIEETQAITVELNAARVSLEQRVEDRTRELMQATQSLEKTNRELTTISEVAAAVVRLQDPEQLLLRVTTLLSTSLGYYHVGVFLLDERHQYAVLKSSNSAGGQRMLERSHRLKIGEVGLVGYVAASGKPRIALDVGKDAVYFDNPDLPETKSELALPLRIGERMIGVLDIQSTEPAAFSEKDLEVFQTLADQVAVAIENARLYGEMKRALSESEQAYAEFVKGSWLHFLTTRKRFGYRYTAEGSRPMTSHANYPEIEQALMAGETVAETKKYTVYAVPLVILGETIGVIDIRVSGKRAWSEEDKDLVRKIAERAALALDNARLVEDAQRRAATEKTIGEITTKIGGSVNLSNILQATAEELGRALPGSEIVVQLESPDRG